jgi:ribonuclease E
MSKKMLINVMHPEEARVAIVQDGRLMELDIEIAGSEQIRGNVYKGVVVRVEPALQAAFVDIGLKRLGFMQMGELHPDFWQWRDDVPEDQRKRRPRIQEVLRRGQELIVQVEKGERDMKGAALTTYMSFPGRYMVLMPGSDSSGISRKVEGEGERKKLKEVIVELGIPEGMGYIVRTEAVGKTKTELKKDLQYLLKLHQGILDKAATVKAPSLVAEETDLVTRTIRDYFTAEIDEVLVDSPAHHKQIKAFFKATMPKFEKLVKLHQEKRPIFSRYQIEEQIDQIYEKKVPLPSGGSLVIEPTEALVSIDVNSGKTSGERGVEDTAFKANVEAAEEVARQLRLRDLGGLIVIDFIDMRDRKHMAEVEKVLKNALKLDKARVTVGKISQFGMLEMSRQRIKQTIEQAIHLECPHCGGRGKVKSVEAMALSFLRKVHAAAAKGNAAEIRGGLPLEVAYYLLNRKKRELVGIENDYEIGVTVKGKTSFLMNQVDLEVIKREKPRQEEHHHVEEAEIAPAKAAATEPGEHSEPLADEVKAKKKRKRNRKKKIAEEGEPLETLVESGLPETVEVHDEESASGDNEDAGHDADATLEPAVDEAGEIAVEEKKKRRRRRKKKKGGMTGELVVSAGEPVDVEAIESGREDLVPRAEEPADGEQEEHAMMVEGKKKRRRRRRKQKTVAEGAMEQAFVEPADSLPVAGEPLPEAMPEQPARPRRSPRGKVAAKTAEEPAGGLPEPAAELPEQPSRQRRSARKGKGDSEAVETGPSSEKPAAKRRGRPKKEQSATD